MTISSMPASSILTTSSSSSSVFAATMTSPVSGSTTSSRDDAAEDAVAERLDDLAGVLELGDADAVERPAVELGDDGVLRDVDETAREVTGVRRLERGVREALTSAVRRDEVLENVRPSRKFAVIGVSMISPEGLAMRPRIAASCRICWVEPRAPESAMM